MTIANQGTVLQWKELDCGSSERDQVNQRSQVSEDHQSNISLASLSQLTGFPSEYIKSELLLKNDNLSLSELRCKILKYLENTMKE